MADVNPPSVHPFIEVAERIRGTTSTNRPGPRTAARSRPRAATPLHNHHAGRPDRRPTATPPTILPALLPPAIATLLTTESREHQRADEQREIAIPDVTLHDAASPIQQGPRSARGANARGSHPAMMPEATASRRHQQCPGTSLGHHVMNEIAKRTRSSPGRLCNALANNHHCIQERSNSSANRTSGLTTT